MIVDYSENSKAKKYNLMAQTIIPRPIAWVVTQNADGLVNVAPFSYFMGLSSQPPTVMVSIGHKKDGSPKDTLANIRQSKKCCICMVMPQQLEAMHFSSKELGATVSEAELFDIQTKQILSDFPPMIKGCVSAFFCEFLQEIELKGSTTIPVVLEIKKQYLKEEIITSEDPLSISFDPLVRIGKTYATLSEAIAPPKIP